MADYHYFICDWYLEYWEKEPILYTCWRYRFQTPALYGCMGIKLANFVNGGRYTLCGSSLCRFYHVTQHVRIARQPQGYGVVHSGISPEEHDKLKCVGLTILVVLEAFCGILIAAMYSAIMLVKVTRIQSFAQVTFSDPMVIRFGSGVAADTGMSGAELFFDDVSSDAFCPEKEIPCPVIEFRVVNRLNNSKGGEIIDATVNIVASVDVRQIDDALRRGRQRRRRRRGKIGIPRLSDTHLGSTELDTTQQTNDKLLASLREPNKGLGHKETKTRGFRVDSSGHVVSTRVFTKLDLESPDHPFFKRTWILSHTLNESSPLLKTSARRLVTMNGGFWPKELNNYKGVRESVAFDQILVSLSGTTNADARSVYSQHLYEYIDVNVGYRFASLLYRDSEGVLGVDPTLINDVIEQHGGGAEPLLCEEACGLRKSNDMVVL
jgi:hypothetical protein